MKAKTIFRAYQECATLMENAAIRRGTIHGISVEEDRWALRWQRYERLFSKCEKRLEAIVAAYDSGRAMARALVGTL